MTSHFLTQLRQRQTRMSGRRWLYVPYDQLSDEMGPLSREPASDLGIVLIESRWKARRRPYHKQKLALLLSNQRHFALEQAQRGVAIRYEFTDLPYHQVLASLIQELGPIRVMEPAERELRVDLDNVTASDGLERIAHEGWLTSAELFAASQPKGPPWRMDAFYRKVRQETGILMKAGKPIGGKYSFDSDNRKAWKGTPRAPNFPTFTPDVITEEVCDLVLQEFSHHPGELQATTIPASKDDANDLWQWIQQHCLPHFGPYQDAMSIKAPHLFHTRLASLLNLHRLLPRKIIQDALALDLSLPSKEGFLRQILGWREFARHVHRETDGFRNVSVPQGSAAGDAGYQNWSGQIWSRDAEDAAHPSYLGASHELPAAFWGSKSGLNCLDHCVSQVWSEGYTAHIPRLMVLANFATLLDISPRDLADWFWVAYTDAYDWVVEPNVLGMGTFAVGDLMTTKPYVSGSAYIHRMSDYCESCAFDPKRNCPIARLYWQFLERHRDQLGDNPRLAMPYRSLQRRGPEDKKQDREVFEQTLSALQRQQPLQPPTRV